MMMSAVVVIGGWEGQKMFGNVGVGAVRLGFVIFVVVVVMVVAVLMMELVVGGRGGGLFVGVAILQALFSFSPNARPPM